MTPTANRLAQMLLSTEAVQLNPTQPFTWASGWNSPIYCDNRRVLAFPEIRSFVKTQLIELVRQHFPQAEAIAGVATGAIAAGALVADAMALPFCYVRPKPKDHGMGNQIEGHLQPGSRVVVVEDLISTGSSSLKAVDALRKAGAQVVGMVASFTYGFDVAHKAFADADVPLFTLSHYDALLHEAVAQDYITADQLPLLAEWRKCPSEWGK